MQSLDIISVNLWHILISLINLLIIFFIVKKFLFKPVKKMLNERKERINRQFADAAEAQAAADANRRAWEAKLETADAEADRIMKETTELAKHRADTIVREAGDRADGIIREAQNEAELERKRATEEIKREIVDVSAAIAEKMLEREVNTEDHRAMIDSFIETVGEEK